MSSQTGGSAPGFTRLRRRGQDPGRLSQVRVSRVGVTYLRISILCNYVVEQAWARGAGLFNCFSTLMYSCF